MLNITRTNYFNTLSNAFDLISGQDEKQDMMHLRKIKVKVFTQK